MCEVDEVKTSSIAKIRKIWLKLFDLNLDKNLDKAEEYLTNKLGINNFMFDDDGGVYIRLGRRYYYLIIPQTWSIGKNVDNYIKPVTAKEFKIATKKHW